ncbi:hypothetical protein Droror1_Dr00025541, partial [Drosera rotundifolia]
MENRNEDKGSFRGHGFQSHYQIDEQLGWRAGMSVTEALNQAQDRMDEGLQQWRTQQRSGPYSQHLSRTSGDFVPRYSQGSIATSLRAMSEQHNSQHIPPMPLSQSEDRTPTNVRDSPTPTFGKSPSGRKAAKKKASAKRQKSQDASSFIGDRIAKSIGEMNALSAAEIAKASVALEKELMAFDALLYSQQPSLIGSPFDAKKRMAERQARIAHLTAQAQDSHVSLSLATSRSAFPHLGFDLVSSSGTLGM